MNLSSETEVLVSSVLLTIPQHHCLEHFTSCPMQWPVPLFEARILCTKATPFLLLLSEAAKTLTEIKKLN